MQRSDQCFNIDCLFKQYVTEWAIPRKHTATVLLKMRDWLKSNQDVKVSIFACELFFELSFRTYINIV